MDASETRRFLTILHGEDEFEVAYIHPTETDPAKKVRRVTRTLSEDLLDEFGRAEASGYNVYASVLPVALQGRTGEAVYDRVWVDQDDPEAPYPFSSDERWDGANWPEPSTLVKTSDAEGGFRWQAIWLLEELLNAEDGRNFVKRLATKAGADEGVHDARRVLRVPGIMNAKRGSMARLMTSKSATTTTDLFDLPHETLMDKLINGEVNNPQHVLGEWLDGAEEGDRNRKAYVVARFLKGCAVHIEDAGPILKLGAQRANPPLSDEELSAALKSAYHRA